MQRQDPRTLGGRALPVNQCEISFILFGFEDVCAASVAVRNASWPVLECDMATTDDISIDVSGALNEVSTESSFVPFSYKFFDFGKMKWKVAIWR